MELSTLQQYLAQEYVPKASYISACLVSINILFMIGMSIYDSKLVNRVSLRLQTALAAYDLWLHTGSLWKTPYAKGPGPLCVFFGWNMVATTLFYSFINVSIGVNLQLIFIHNKKITKRIEVGYWLVPILLSLIISVPPLALGRFGWYSYGGCYMIAPDGNEYQMKMLDLLGVQLWRSISLVYLIVIVTIVFLRLNRQVSITGPNKSRIDPKLSSKATKAVKLLGYRM
ncbi:hypothetical protein K502DRAFT_325459 [Neoconidiobolus thromboides FSU 785]|nr:hypothetical protein K502DRAFT_325459 [Neoconidiobolus thromboides FSU 785]